MHALERKQIVTHVRVFGQIKEKMLKLQNTPSDPKAVELTKTVQIAKERRRSCRNQYASGAAAISLASPLRKSMYVSVYDYLRII